MSKQLIKRVGELNLEYSKADVVQIAEQHAHQLLDKSQYDLLYIYVELKRYETYLKTLINTVKPATLAKAKATGKQLFDYAGATVKVAKQSKYDYSSDDYWRATNETYEQLQSLKKGREQFLRSIKGTHRDVIDPETGEVQTVFAPNRIKKEMLVVSLG